MEVPSFDKLELQPQPLPNCPLLDTSLGTEKGLKPPIKPQNPGSFIMKVLDNLTIHTPPLSLLASFHLSDLYFYYRPCIDDPKKHYEFKPVPTGRYIVPTGRVIVPTGRYVVPAGSNNDSDHVSIYNEALNNHQQPNIQPQIITTVRNNNAKLPYLKKDVYEVWAMKMEYWITNNDMNIWKVIQNGNSLKRTGRDNDRGLIILPLTTAEEHLNAVKARFGGNTESKKIRKSMLKQEVLEFRISEAEGLHKGFLRALPSSWSQVALTLKTKGGLEFLSFDDLYYKLKTLEVDIKGYITFSSSQSARPSHSAFVSATITNKKMSYGDSLTHSSTTTYSVPSNFKTGSYRTDLEQIEKLDLEEMDLKWQMTMLPRYSSFKIKEIGKKEKDSKALVTVDTLVDWTNHDSESDGVIAAKEFGMIVGCDSRDALKEGTVKLYNWITGANSKEANTAGDAGEVALMGVTSETYRHKLIIMWHELKSGESENELGWDDSAFSVFTTNSEDVEGRPIFHSDKSSAVNTHDLASSDSGLKSLEHKPTDSSCASTSSVSTYMNEAEIDSNVKTPFKEPISVQDLPSFTCNSYDKNEHSSRTSCNKNGSFNKKVGHFRKYALSVSKLCFVYGSGTHLIKDCDFYEKQMTNTTVGIGVGPAVRPLPVATSKLKVKPIPTGKPKATLVPTGRPKGTPVPTGELKATPVPTGKPTGTPVPNSKPKVHPVPTGKPKFTPVPTSRPNRPFPIATDRGCSPSVPSGWWSHTASPMPHLINPTSLYFQTYTVTPPNWVAAEY
nr:hypothetical protein [Tanacetum cinerariifolium]